jgi:hypothetical protein
VVSVLLLVENLDAQAFHNLTNLSSPGNLVLHLPFHDNTFYRTFNRQRIRCPTLVTGAELFAGALIEVVIN